MIEHLTVEGLSPALMVALALGGLLAVVVAFKVGKFLLKLIFALIALALLGAAVYWFFLRPTIV